MKGRSQNFFFFFEKKYFESTLDTVFCPRPRRLSFFVIVFLGDMGFVGLLYFIYFAPYCVVVSKKCHSTIKSYEHPVHFKKSKLHG